MLIPSFLVSGIVEGSDWPARVMCSPEKLEPVCKTNPIRKTKSLNEVGAVPEQGQWILLEKNNVNSLYVGCSFPVASAWRTEQASVSKAVVSDSSLRGTEWKSG